MKLAKVIFEKQVAVPGVGPTRHVTADKLEALDLIDSPHGAFVRMIAKGDVRLVPYTKTDEITPLDAPREGKKAS